MEWASESLEMSLRYAYANVDGREVLNGTLLGEDYYERAWPILQERMAAAAVRLAHTFGVVL